MTDTTPYANSIFEQPWWLDTVAPEKWGEALVKEADEIIARMPYAVNKNKICMPPLTQTLGPWIKDREPQVGNTHLSKQKAIINELLAQFPKHKYMLMRCDSTNSYILPYRWHGFNIKPTFSYRIKDLTDLDAIYNRFNKTAKKNIKSANNKVCIKDDTDLNLLLNILNITFAIQDRKSPIDKKLINKIVTNAEKHIAGKMFYAIDDSGVIHSAAYLVYDEKVCYYLLGGSDDKYRSSGAQSLILWEAIQFASTVSKAFDFEGSMVEGIENFFRQFGGEQVINYQISKMPFIYDCKELLKPRVKRLLGYKV